MTLFSNDLLQQADILLRSLQARDLKLATAESCTGGMVGALLTETPGGSRSFTHGYVTYVNQAKTEMLGVKESLLKEYGAVSEEVAIAMAEGALKASSADVSVSITGIAGPGGATATKPVGLVHFASARKGYSTLHLAERFSGNRTLVRLQATAMALELVMRQLAR